MCITSQREDWVVAYVRGTALAWCGWPEGLAQLADCRLIRKGQRRRAWPFCARCPPATVRVVGTQRRPRGLGPAARDRRSGREPRPTASSPATGVSGPKTPGSHVVRTAELRAQGLIEADMRTLLSFAFMAGWHALRTADVNMAFAVADSDKAKVREAVRTAIAVLREVE